MRIFYKILTFVTILICLASCGSLTPVPITEVSIPIAITPTFQPLAIRPPAAILEINGKSQQAGIGSYCWSNGAAIITQSLCADMANIHTAREPLVVETTPFSAVFHMPLESPPDSLSTSVMPATKEIATERKDLRLWNISHGRSSDLPLEKNVESTFQEGPGLYVIMLEARWKEWGSVSYGFLIQVGEISVIPPTAQHTPVPTSTLMTLQAIPSLARLGKGTVLSSEFSPDGKRFATVTPLGIYINSVDTLQQLDFISADPPVHAAVFSPDWSSIAIAKGSTVILRHVDDNQILTHLETQQGIVYHLLFSSDGSLLASFVKPPGDEVYSEIVELWHVGNGQRLSSWQVSIYDNTFFAPDGKTFFAWNESSQMAGVRRWHIPSGTALPGWMDLDPYPLVFSPDGKLYAATTNAAILLQSIADKTRTFKLPIAANDTAYLMRFSPDSSLLFCWFSDGMLRVWRTKGGSQLNSFQAGPPTVRFLAISPDNQTLAFPTFDGIAFYSLVDGSLLRRLDDHLNGIEQAAISPKGDKAAALVSGDGLMVWDLPNGNLRYSLSQGGAINLAWSPDGQSLVLGGWDDSLRILHAANGETMRSIPAHTEQVQSVAFSPDGDLLASSSMESVKLWRENDDSLLQSYSVPGGWVPKVKFSPDGKFLAATSANGKVIVWQTGNENVFAELSISNLASDRDVVDFSADGSYLVIGEMSQIDLWRLNEPKPFDTFPVGDATVVTLRISPDGSFLVCGLTDGNILFWQIPEGKLMRTIQSGSEGIASLDFSADGRILLAASRDGTIQVWNIEK